MEEKTPLKKALPLRERRDEVLQIVRDFIKLADGQLRTGHKELSKEAEEYLLTYKWLDEKELENAVKRACILSDGHELQIEDFDIRQRQIKSIGMFIEERLKGLMRNIGRFERFNLYDTVIPEVERALILMVLRETKGNQLRAAGLLGINRNTLREKIKKLGIDTKKVKSQ